jgi:hypothetical protein
MEFLAVKSLYLQTTSLMEISEVPSHARLLRRKLRTLKKES